LSAFVAIVFATVVAALALFALAPVVAGARAKQLDARARRTRRPRPGTVPLDPGRERRAERKARELMRSIIDPADYEMYESLGFLRVLGRDEQGTPNGYGYLVYPHRPIVSYDTATDEPLSEYCVEFPDHGEPAYGERLPDADDALAKWMSLHGDERKLIGDANMHLPGRQVDPGQVRRDLRRMREWELQNEPERSFT
jgi:hypothetical protein